MSNRHAYASEPSRTMLPRGFTQVLVSQATRQRTDLLERDLVKIMLITDAASRTACPSMSTKCTYFRAGNKQFCKAFRPRLLSV